MFNNCLVMWFSQDVYKYKELKHFYSNFKKAFLMLQIKK
jgi:hypothetical protein